MTIATVRARAVEARYLVPFAIAGGTTDVLETLLVEIADVDGRTGIGEVNPMTAYSGVGLDEVRRCIDEVLAPALVGVLTAPGPAHAAMDRAATGAAARLAKAGVDIAVHDLQARALGVPVHALLGGAHRAEVDLAWVVGLRPVADTVAEARDRADMGHRTIKLKIGIDPDRDVAAVRAVREALPDVRLRVDANGGYDPPTAVRVLRAVSGCGLELVEQPVAGRDIAGLAGVRAETGLRILADEALQTPADALALVRADACDALNVKIAKPGGLYRARQVAAVAEAAGIDVMVGSMPELGVATAAGVHFALSLPAQPFACELLGPFMVERDVVADGGLQLVDGSLRLGTRLQGLGVELVA